MNRAISISPSERTVLRILWEASEPLRASEVTARLTDKTGWQLTTVRTFLARLEKKGAARSHPDVDGVTVFAPALLENDLRLLEEETALDRYFDGALSGVMSRFIEAGKVSEEELRAIRAMIDERIQTIREEQ